MKRLNKMELDKEQEGFERPKITKGWKPEVSSFPEADNYYN